MHFFLQIHAGFRMMKGESRAAAAMHGGRTMATDILSHIQSNMDGFSKGQKLISAYMMEAYDKAAFMTASKLGKTVGVSESTVVRFAVELGYDGYPSMQKALQEVVRNKLTSVQRMEVTNNLLGNQDLVSMVLQSDVETIRATADALDRESFEQAVEEILHARNIYIVGVRSSAALAAFLNFYLRNMMDNVRLVGSNAVSEMFEQLVHISPEDVVIGISFPRYSSRTVKAMQFCRDSGARVVAITDSRQAPAAKIAQNVLIAKSDMVSIVDSLVAPLSLINALIVSIGRKKETDLSRIYAELEHMWEEYDVYERIEN